MDPYGSARIHSGWSFANCTPYDPQSLVSNPTLNIVSITITRKHRVTNPGSQKQSIFYAFFGFGFFSGTLVSENLLNLLWLILKPYKTFMHKHTFSGPGVRLKRARTLGPEKSRTLEFSNPADPDLGPGEFENHMKCDVCVWCVRHQHQNLKIT